MKAAAKRSERCAPIETDGSKEIEPDLHMHPHPLHVPRSNYNAVCNIKLL
jgi:hypothetical protein